MNDVKADRLALDGLDEFSQLFENEIAFKSGLAKFRRELRKNDCTSFVTSKDGTGVKNLVDGVLILHYDGGLEKTRAIEIRKMRKTNHTDRICPFETTVEGMVITGPSKENGE